LLKNGNQASNSKTQDRVLRLQKPNCMLTKQTVKKFQGTFRQNKSFCKFTKNYMSTKYKFADKEGIYFTTSTVVAWTDVFTRDVYRDILLDSIRFCQHNQGLLVHAWVLMTNHLHMICSCQPGKDLAQILRNTKSFTAMKLIDAIINNPNESRRENILNIFEAEGRKSSSNFRFKFWEHENHPVLLGTMEMYMQRLNYLHFNPVKAGFVTEPFHWKNSSAADYYTKEKGLLDLIMLD
jgi:putative transposase